MGVAMDFARDVMAVRRGSTPTGGRATFRHRVVAHAAEGMAAGKTF